jgi:hypothetical protein
MSEPHVMPSAGVTPAPAPSPEPSGTTRGPLRIAGRALLVLLVVGALVAALAWGFTNRASAEKWRDRSGATDEDLRRSLDRLEATSRDLEQAEDQLAEVASDKANETDRNRILSEVVAEAPAVTEAMRECQEETTDLANDIIAAFGDPSADVAALEQRSDEVNDICRDALDAARALEAAIEDLDI